MRTNKYCFDAFYFHSVDYCHSRAQYQATACESGFHSTLLADKLHSKEGLSTNEGLSTSEGLSTNHRRKANPVGALHPSDPYQGR